MTSRETEKEGPPSPIGSGAASPTLSKWRRLKETLFRRKDTPTAEELTPPPKSESVPLPETPPVAKEPPGPESEAGVEEERRADLEPLTASDGGAMDAPEPTEAPPPAFANEIRRGRPAAAFSSPMPEPRAEREKGDREKKGRSGSAKRQRVKGVRAVVTPAEYDAIQERARNAGLSVGAYLRACALGDKGPRAKRAPPIQGDLLAQAIAALNRVGNNVNQIAHHLNAGGHPDRARIAENSDKLDACLSAILKALGRAE